MKYEVLKRSHLKRNIIIALIVVGVISAIILNFTRAKYRTTESIPLIQGTINFSPSDFNILAFYLNKGTETISADKAPHVGYTLNTEQSTCEVNDKDAGGEIVYEDGNLSFMNMNYKGTKCSVYFDLIPDSENPVLHNINSSSLNDNSVTINIEATDNIGIFYYYYKLDNEEEIRTEENSYTFEELEKDSVHTITVRVEDAAGNVSETKNKEVIVGIRGKDYILASVNKPTGQTTDWTGKISYYYTGNPNNWVQFAGFYWRIIRINGDGSIRMVYQGIADSETPDNGNMTGEGTQIGTSAFNSSFVNNMYVGFKYTSGQVHGTRTNSTILGGNSNSSLNTWYINNLADEAEYLDGNAGFCGDRIPYSGSGTGTSDTYYAAYNRLVNNNNPSLQCDIQDVYTTTDSSSGNKSLTYSIGLISVDEVALAGIPWWENGSDTNNYLYIGLNYWTMSPCYFRAALGDARVFYVNSSGNFIDQRVNNTYGVRPVINIRSDVEITGSGTTTDPFRVVGAS